MCFETKQMSAEPDAIAPDGSKVRVLCQLSRNGLAAFSLAPKAVSKAVAHRTIEEVWYFTSGHGRVWRRSGEHEEIVEVAPGISISIPTGTHFQFRCDGIEPLMAIGATMPPCRATPKPFLSKENGIPPYECRAFCSAIREQRFLRGRRQVVGYHAASALSCFWRKALVAACGAIVA